MEYPKNQFKKNLPWQKVPKNSLAKILAKNSQIKSEYEK